MSLWSKLFGSKTRTIDDEIREAAIAMGMRKSDIPKYVQKSLDIGLTKEDILTAYREEAAKKK